MQLPKLATVPSRCNAEGSNKWNYRTRGNKNEKGIFENESQVRKIATKTQAHKGLH